MVTRKNHFAIRFEIFRCFNNLMFRLLHFFLSKVQPCSINGK